MPPNTSNTELPLPPVAVKAAVYGLPIAAVRREAGGESGRFDGPGGIELACWQPSGGGTLVHFAPDLEREPLVKMSLLAATLVR